MHSVCFEVGFEVFVRSIADVFLELVDFHIVLEAFKLFENSWFISL